MVFKPNVCGPKPNIRGHPCGANHETKTFLKSVHQTVFLRTTSQDN